MVIVPNYNYKNGAGVEKSMALYDKLFSERIIYIYGEITDEMAASVTAQLLTLDAANPGKDIQLYINSPGGSVTAGLAIYDVMRTLKSDVCTVACGLAASMGAFLLAAGCNGKRTALKHTQIMLHQVLGSASGQAVDVEIAAKNLMKMRKTINNCLSSFMGIQAEKIESLCDRDYWLTAEEARNIGIIDTVI